MGIVCLRSDFSDPDIRTTPQKYLPPPPKKFFCSIVFVQDGRGNYNLFFVKSLHGGQICPKCSIYNVEIISLLPIGIQYTVYLVNLILVLFSSAFSYHYHFLPTSYWCYSSCFPLLSISCTGESIYDLNFPLENVMLV